MSSHGLQYTFRESANHIREHKRCNYGTLNPNPIIIIIIIIIIIRKKGWHCRAGRERLTPYQSEDPSPIIPTQKTKAEKMKTVGDVKGESSI